MYILYNTYIYKILDLLNQQGKITFSALDIMCTHTERIPYKAVTTYEQMEETRTLPQCKHF